MDSLRGSPLCKQNNSNLQILAANGIGSPFFIYLFCYYYYPVHVILQFIASLIINQATTYSILIYFFRGAKVIPVQYI